MSLQSTFLGTNDSLFSNVNKFQSTNNILDLFCDWLRTSRMIHLEPWKVHSNAFCLNDATSCNIWKFKLVPSNSLWKELSKGIRFAYVRWPPGLAHNAFSQNRPILPVIKGSQFTGSLLAKLANFVKELNLITVALLFIICIKLALKKQRVWPNLQNYS